MSDPVTNVEIEDVLASIRRLVSQGDRTAAAAAAEPAARRDDAPDAAGTGSEEVERLVLTPALRVTGGNTEPSSDSVETTGRPVPETAAEAAPEWPQAEMAEIAEFRIDPPDAEPQGDGQRSVDDPEAGTPAMEPASELRPEPVSEPTSAPTVDPNAEDAEGGASDRVDADLDDKPLALSPPEADVSDGGPETAEDMTSAPERPQRDTPQTLRVSDQAGRTSLLATIAELEAAVGGSEGWEPDGSEAEPQVDWDGLGAPPRVAAQDPATVSGAAAPQPETAAPGAEPALEPAAGTPDRPTTGEPDTPTTAAPDTPTNSEPDTLANGAPDSPVTAPEPPKDTQDVSSSAPEADPPGDLDEDLSALMAQSGMIDEETLRDMVSEIVREELQGALGERITRNVRKLVRREIYRILSSQDFD